MRRRGSEQEEEVYEHIPEPQPPAPAQPEKRGAAAPTATSRSDGLDVSSAPGLEAFSSFRQREAEAAAAAGAVSAAPGRRRRRAEYKALGGEQRVGEAPEQRLARLQAEVADLIHLAEMSQLQDGGNAAELLGADPAVVTKELHLLETRLGGLVKGGVGLQQAGSETSAGAGHGALAGSLVAQLERLASGPAVGGAAPTSTNGSVTYEISYTPSAAAIADSSSVATLESSIADIERQLGVLEPDSPFSDLQSAVEQLHKRLSLLDAQKLDSIRNGVHKVMGDLEQALAKKAELEGSGADPELDNKVSRLYDMCHRWGAAASSLPTLVSRLQTLQALHQQSASFASRLGALEKQQDELAGLLDATSIAVQELGISMQENMRIMKDNMQSLEEKITKALKK